MKKKILLIDGVYPINTRSRRIIKSLKNDFFMKYCSWDRKSIVTEEEKNIQYIYSSNEGYGNKIKKLKGIYKFYKYLKYINKTFKPDILIASQWDMLILCTLLKKKNQKLVYDNIDMPTSSNKMILFILKKIELFCLERTDSIIYASRFFNKEYNNYSGKELILENNPMNTINNDKKYNFCSSKLKLSFIGTVRYYEIMKNLIDELKNREDDIDFLIFGSGPDEKRLKKLVKNNNQKNVHFFGAYSYEEIASFYNISDVIWAVYPNKDYNVKYAISNKFFESILFEKPCLFAKGTHLGKLVEKNKIGFTVDPYDLVDEFLDVEKIKIEILRVKANIKKYKKNTDIYWEDVEKKLIEFIKEIL